MRFKQGLTLIELMLIIAIIGILVVAGGFGVKSFLDAARLREAVTTIQVQTAEARRIAKQSDGVVEVSVEEQDGAWVLDLDGRVSRLTGVTVTSGSTDLRLNPPYGTYSGADQEIVLRIGNREAIVTITGVLARTVVVR